MLNNNQSANLLSNISEFIEKMILKAETEIKRKLKLIESFLHRIFLLFNQWLSIVRVVIIALRHSFSRRSIQ